MTQYTDKINDERNYPDYIEHVFEFHITSGQMPERVDTFLAHSIHNATRSKVQQAIDESNVLINGKNVKASKRIQPGDHVICRVMKPPPMELIPENIPLEIVFEDDDLLVINKPAGMVTHPGFGNRFGTLVNAVLYHFGVRDAQTLEVEGEDEDLVFHSDTVRPGIVHRLDKDTSGIMVVAKNYESHVQLAKQFELRTAKREYWAVAWGIFKEEKGLIEANLGRSPRNRKLFAVVKDGKYAGTEYSVLERFEFLSLISLRLRTGRTHQIRVHAAHIRHPLFGDEAYGGTTIHYGGNLPKQKQRVDNLLEIMPRQALHAKTLAFTHPKTGIWMEFDSDLPQDFQNLLAAVRI